ncbi:MAG TPA: protein translocase subunit SecD [Mycobacteriales bacterium]|nr:protein translocase subunit SecD [Mycobacteriales bacterium]
MAAPSGSLPIGRYLGALAGILVVLYALVFFTGSSATPKLGLDLEGGTQVTLQAKTTNNQPPSSDALNQARQIIERRVNGLGVAEAEVVTQGRDRIIISVPGANGDQAKTVGQTAQLRFRPLITSAAAAPAPAGTATPSGTASPAASGSAAPSASASGSASPQGFAPAPAATTPAASAPAAPAATAPAGTDTTIPATPPAGVDPAQYQQAVLAYQKLTCSADSGAAASVDKPTDVIPSCDQNGATKYLLAPAIIEGTDISGASAVAPTSTSPQWTVSLDFKSKGQSTWAQYTSAHNVTATPNDPANNVAFVLDGKTISAPAIQGTINGQTQITGSFTQSDSQDLANVLKYGALPLTFQQQEALTVSPTLGTDQLKAGLLAGGIGVALVFIYSLLYYRALGLVMIASLLLSGIVVYAALVILGRQIGFTLTLAGVAGFIVAIGITADSFVVFFERLKDEIRDGRSPRSAVPRAWVRARRTILSADAVSFLAAAILYYLAAGTVKGFAFTLGMSTILDLVIVFLFTHPLVTLFARNKAFMSPRVSGLGSVQKIAAQRAAAERAAAPARTPARSAAGRRGRVSAKES